MEITLKDLKKQNPWWENPSRIEEDIKISMYKEAEHKWEPALLDKLLKWEKGSLHTLRGPRQVGKSTLMKLLIEELLEEQPPETIFYFTCDILDGKEELVDLIQSYLEWVGDSERLYIFLDEITAVESWQEAIKMLIDTGQLQNVSLLVSGSNAVDIRESGETLPGRRGGGENHILAPMKFSQFLDLADPPFLEKIQDVRNMESSKSISRFFEEDLDELKSIKPFVGDLNRALRSYLLTGGFPRPVDEFLSDGQVDRDSYKVYQSSVLGGIFKRGKKESYLRDLVSRLLETQTSSVGWTALKRYTGIKDQETVEDYIRLLKDMFVLNLVHKADPNKKKANTAAYKKIYFSDPFILHAMNAWVNHYEDPLGVSEKSLDDPEFRSRLVEQVVANHLTRLSYRSGLFRVSSPESRVFYWSNSREVDFLYKMDGSLLPIEVKYKNDVGGGWEWIRKRFGKPVVLSKEDWEVKEEYVVLPASLFLALI